MGSFSLRFSSASFDKNFNGYEFPPRCKTAQNSVKIAIGFHKNHISHKIEDVYKFELDEKSAKR